MLQSFILDNYVFHKSKVGWPYLLNLTSILVDKGEYKFSTFDDIATLRLYHGTYDRFGYMNKAHSIIILEGTTIRLGEDYVF